MANWYASSVAYTAVTAWSAGQVVAVGALRRQLAAPAVNNERVFRCTTAGTTGGAEPAWVLTKGATTNDNTAVWTEVTGNATYGWTAAHARLFNAFAWNASGDNIFLSSDHAETQATSNALSTGANDFNTTRIISVNRAGSVPPVAADVLAGATITTTGASPISIDGTCYYYGVTFNVGSGANQADLTFNGSRVQNFDRCNFNLNTTVTSTTLRMGPDYGQRSRLNWNNCTVFYGVSGIGVYANSGYNFKWTNDTSVGYAVTGGLTGYQVLPCSGSYAGLMEYRGLDLSNLTGTIINSVPGHFCRFVNCKLPVGVAVASWSSGNCGAEVPYVDVIGCNTGSVIERNERYHLSGELKTETTIKRTGGASDGATGYSWRIESLLYFNDREVPFESFEGTLWNTAVGLPKTLTVHLVNDGVTLTNDDVWLEVEYLNSGSFTTIAKASSRLPLLGAASNLPASTETWTTTGLTTPVKQALSVTFTPLLAGPIRYKVVIGKKQQVFYACPKAEIA